MNGPVKVYSEINAVRLHADELAALGRRALIVTGGGSSRKNGSLDDVISALSSGGREYSVFDEVEENPSVETVLRAAHFGREEKAGFVIGVGGGSALDAAKAIAFLLAQGEISSELLYGGESDTRLPLALIPTTCGTGSEVTPVSVLTLTAAGTKKSVAHRLFPDLALVDGRYLKTAPLQLLRNTSLDALTHLIESRLNTRATDMSRTIADKGLDLWRSTREAIEGGFLSEELMQTMMNASLMGGRAIALTSTTLPHALSYPMTIRKGVPHGKAVGYFTAGYIAECEASEQRYILEKTGFSDIAELQSWYKELYAPEKADGELIEASIELLWQNKPKLKTALFKADLEALRRIAYYT